jgi:hypothetical protein
MNAPSDYSYTVKKRMSTDDLLELQSIHYPKLVDLNNRYAPQIDISRGIRREPEYLDLIRGLWLLDNRPNCPPYADVVSGLGFGFGLLLNHIFGMEWCLIEDNFGEDISMIRFRNEAEPTSIEMSVPPFSYVAKREKLQNVEVFADCIAHVRQRITPLSEG